MTQRIVLHIDANSAYLSWEAVYRLQHGSNIDLREIPSVVGGDASTRHGIVLTKSIPAKKYKIKTGEVLWEARSKCPNLVVVPPNYALYMQCSSAMVDILKTYSPEIERYSIDECFLELSSCKNIFPDPVKTAYEIKDRIYKELGFTVNIGVSSSKLLAKMASEFKKPNMVHTLFPEEIPSKMWPLKISELFMVGRRSAPKLNRLNIFTIGDLAKSDPELLHHHLKSYGISIWKFANGIDDSTVHVGSRPIKGLGNSTITPFDVINKKEAKLFILSLIETCAMRLRDANCMARVVAVSLRTSEFKSYSHQMKFDIPTANTNEICKYAYKLFDEMWQNESIRHFGVRLSELCSNEFYQTSIFDSCDYLKKSSLDKAIDKIRICYGDSSIVRASFIHSGIPPLCGGVHEDYPMMSSLL